MRIEFTKKEMEKRQIPNDPYGHIDFTSFKNGAEIIDRCKDDGLAWATAFKQFTKKNLDLDIDLWYIHSWFCNAIEGSHQCREQQKESLKKENEAAWMD